MLKELKNLNWSALAVIVACAAFWVVVIGSIL